MDHNAFMIGNLGIAFRYNEPVNTLMVFGMAVHGHTPDDGNLCPFRAGIELTFFNLDIAIGLWQ